VSSSAKDEYVVLLDDLSDLGSGQAETESEEKFKKGFFPVPQHLRAFDPDVILIVGERGTGKSELFRAVFKSALVDHLGLYMTGSRLSSATSGQIRWITGHPAADQFPDPRGLKKTLTTPEKCQSFWFAYLIRALANEIDAPSLRSLLKEEAASPEKVLMEFDKAGNESLLALDRLDRKMRDSDKWIFVGYDELDTLGGFDWDVMARAVRGLVTFWASYSRRWMRLRAKLFIRTDMFRRHAEIGGADLPKLSANRVELTWSNLNLLSMLIKRIANRSEGLLSFCRKGKISFPRQRDAVLGHIPILHEAEDARLLITRMVGQYMGANPRKGQSFSWILDHIRDGKKKSAPRSLVRLFEEAAAQERHSPRSIPPQLLHPTSLRQALEKVSYYHVSQAISNEWPWLNGVRERIQKNRLVPWARKEIQQLLEEKWNDSWGESTQHVYAPVKDAKELVEYLVELGVFRERMDGRIDVPDIYLYGLKLRRKGGVKKK
jgi:hypothetical protein